MSKTRGEAPPQDIGVLYTLIRLGEVFEKGVSEIDLTLPEHNGTKRVSVKYTPQIQKRIARRIEETPVNVFSQEGITVEGTLDLAEGKGKISPIVGDPVAYVFDPDKAVEVVGAMRKPVKARINSRTKKIESIEVQKPPFGDDFFAAKSIDQLIAEQGVQPITDLTVLAGAIPDEELDDFLTQIHNDRA
jgi:hypothetical protein